MIEIGNIITLENNEEYLILEKLTEDSSKYIYTVRVLEDETPTDEYVIYETVKNDEGEFIKPLTDKDKYDDLIDQFRDIVIDKIVDLDQTDSDNQTDIAA